MSQGAVHHGSRREGRSLGLSSPRESEGRLRFCTHPPVLSCPGPLQFTRRLLASARRAFVQGWPRQRLLSQTLGSSPLPSEPVWVGSLLVGSRALHPPLPLDDWCPPIWLHRKHSPKLDHCLLIFELSGNELREADCLRFLLPSFCTASQAGRRSWTAPGCWLRCTFGGAQQQERTRLLLQPFLTAQLPSPYWHLQQNASWCHTVISCHF